MWVRVPPPAQDNNPANQELFLVCVHRLIFTEGVLVITAVALG